MIYISFRKGDAKNGSFLYLNESINEVWSARTLDRNIASQYYYRLLQLQTKDVVIDEMKQIRENADIRFSTQSTNFNVWGMPFFTESKRHIFDTAIKQSLEI